MTEHLVLTKERDVFLDTLCLPAYPGLPKRKAMLILPGGGYTHLAPHEAEPVAAAYFADDFNTFTLSYTVNRPGGMCDENGLLYPLLDAYRAILTIRRNADRFGIDPEKVFVIGFSAGAHLAALAATRFADPAILTLLGAEKEELRPTAALPVYGVLSPATCTLLEELFGNIDDSEKRRALVRANTPSLLVTDETPPMFLCHTIPDEVVPFTNTVEMSLALYEKKIPHEVMLFPEGKHGMGLCDSNPHTDGCAWREENAGWFRQSLRFLTYLFGEN